MFLNFCVVVQRSLLHTSRSVLSTWCSPRETLCVEPYRCVLGATIGHVDPGWTALVLRETSNDLQGKESNVTFMYRSLRTIVFFCLYRFHGCRLLKEDSGRKRSLASRIRLLEGAVERYRIVSAMCGRAQPLGLAGALFRSCCALWK